MATNPAGAVIALSSHVARGSVGNRSMVFALERLGLTVWAVPTVILPQHPGHGPAERIVADDAAFAGLLERLMEGGRGVEVAGIVSGYLASPAQAAAVAALVRSVKAARPDAVYLCDPVIGDAVPGGPGRIYVGEALASAIRDLLLPLADVITPNAFECAWLAGAEHSAADRTASDLATLAAGLAPVALVTSAPALMRGQIGNLLVGAGEPLLFEHPASAGAAKGTGDLLAALLLARRLQGFDWPKATGMALASVVEVVAATARGGFDELRLAELQQALVQPRAPVAMRRINAPKA